MLKATFQCFEGLSESAECRLWEHGCLSWRDFLNNSGGFLSERKRQKIIPQLQDARIAYDNCMIDWFVNRLKGAAQLRILHDFWDNALFLDIETTGLEKTAEVTSVGTWRNGVCKAFVKGFNLSDLLTELAASRLLVTYNGARFDLPCLRRLFKLDLAQPHIDLLYPLRALGYRGGLKPCEKSLNFHRQYSEGNDGAEAVCLWERWRKNHDRKALKKLVLYNLEDVYSMVYLSVKLLPRSMQPYPEIPKSALPEFPEPASIWKNIAL